MSDGIKLNIMWIGKKFVTNKMKGMMMMMSLYNHIASTLINFLSNWVCNILTPFSFISSFNWVFKIYKKCLFAYFAFFDWGIFVDVKTFHDFDTFTPKWKLLSVSISGMSILIEN